MFNVSAADPFLRPGKGQAWRIYEKFEAFCLDIEAYQQILTADLLRNYVQLQTSVFHMDRPYWGHASNYRYSKMHAVVLRHRMKREGRLQNLPEQTKRCLERDVQQVLDTCAQIGSNRGTPFTALTIVTMTPESLGQRLLQTDILRATDPDKFEKVTDGNSALSGGISYIANLWGQALVPNSHVDYEAPQARKGMDHMRQHFNVIGDACAVPFAKLQEFKARLFEYLMAYNITVVKGGDGLLQQTAEASDIQISKYTFPRDAVTFIHKSGHENHVWMKTGQTDIGRSVSFSSLMPPF